MTKILMTLPKAFTLAILCTCATEFSVAQMSQFGTVNENYIISNSIGVPGITQTAQVTSLTVDQNNQIVQYFDGMGRPFQVVTTQGSPLKKDIVMPMVYDQFGREALKYLPYVSTQDNGHLKVNPVGTTTYLGSQHQQYYNNGLGDKVADDTHPYSAIVFEASPLSRATKTYGAGASWHTDPADRSIRNFYEFNSSSDNVLLLTYSVPASQFETGIVLGSTATIYANNQLYKNITQDEMGNRVIEYLDKDGRTILKRVQAVSGNPAIDDTNYASTYYIYNNLGALVCVIPPEATRLMMASGANYFDKSDADKRTFLEQWTFQYSYDSKGFISLKQVPGAKPVFMLYDNRDRLVLTQDGNQRAASPKEWTFTKYDALNRPILTGIYNSDDTPATLQSTLSSVASTETYIGSGSGNILGYTNNSFPAVSNAAKYLTVTWYDAYDSFNNPPAYAYAGGLLTNQVASPASLVRGQAVASMVKNLGNDSWMRTVTYYDDKYRVIQSVGDHHQGTIRVTNVIDFTGKVLNTKRTYVAFGQTTTITEKFGYDHAGRLLSIRHSLNGATEVAIAVNQYNEVGQLVAKGLHHSAYPPVDGEIGQPNTVHLVDIQRNAYSSGEQKLIATNSVRLLPGFHTTTGATFKAKIGFTDQEAADYALPNCKQVVDYRYNIRGWLTRINNADVSSVADGNIIVDYFGMELAYNNSFSGFTSSPAFNGNISAMKWGKGNGSASMQAYSFGYDAMNRLQNASHFDYQGAVWLANNNAYDESMTYDHNGNIASLQRKGYAGSNMDNLIYACTGNQLNYVNDTGSATEGFRNANTGTDDYHYDANGNLTRDRNKGINNIGDIRYNLLNLPKEVIKGSESIKYIYDATGKKLRQEVYNGATLVKATDYIGELIYEGTTTPALQFVQHAEGRVIPNGSSPEYQYHLKDHLGNIRLSFTTKNETESNTATLESGNLSAEQNKFLRYEHAKRVTAAIFDHTNGATTGSAVRLNGTSNERYGIARSIAVMPGDKLNIEVYAKYVDTNSSNWNTALTNLMSSIAANTAGVVAEGASYSGGTSTSTFVYPNLNGTSGSSGAGPKAYLNWIIFDGNYNFKNGGYKRLSTAAMETGTDVAHERLYQDNIIISEAGYVYIYLSNENDTPVEVYFDDLKVEHIKGPIVQMDDYYPFGLTFNSYQRENSVDQKFKFQGQEHIDDLDLGWDSFKWRNHQPDIGRFFNVDPLAEKYYYNSPYAFSENKVVAHIELEGLESHPSQALLQGEIKKVEQAWNSFVAKVEEVAEKVVDALTVPDEPEFKAVDEKSSDPTGTGPLDWNGTNEAPFNPDAKPHIKNNDAETLNTTEGGQTGSSGGAPTNLKEVKEVYSNADLDTVGVTGNVDQNGNIYDKYVVIRNGKDTIDERSYIPERSLPKKVVPAPAKGGN